LIIACGHVAPNLKWLVFSYVLIYEFVLSRYISFFSNKTTIVGLVCSSITPRS
jgi:hypothetical protein